MCDTVIVTLGSNLPKLFTQILRCKILVRILWAKSLKAFQNGIHFKYLKRDILYGLSFLKTNHKTKFEILHNNCNVRNLFMFSTCVVIIEKVTNQRVVMNF